MLKSIFSGLQRYRWQYLSILIYLAVVASQICEILRKIELTAVLGVNRKRICNFLLVFGRISYCFWDIEV